MEINDLVQTVESYSNFNALRQVYRVHSANIHGSLRHVNAWLYLFYITILLCLLLVFAKIIIECFDCSLFKIKKYLKINLLLYINM